MLLKAFEEVGCEMRGEIDEYFKRFENTSIYKRYRKNHINIKLSNPKIVIYNFYEIIRCRLCLRFLLSYQIKMRF